MTVTHTKKEDESHSDNLEDHIQSLNSAIVSSPLKETSKARLMLISQLLEYSRTAFLEK